MIDSNDFPFCDEFSSLEKTLMVSVRQRRIPERIKLEVYKDKAQSLPHSRLNPASCRTHNHRRLPNAEVKFLSLGY
jgi:hypothetical protein